MEDRRKRTKLLFLEKLFTEQTDEEHALTLSEINERLESYGIKPVDRKTLYGDFEELRAFGLDIISETRNGKGYYYLGPGGSKAPTRASIIMLTVSMKP